MIIHDLSSHEFAGVGADPRRFDRFGWHHVRCRASNHGPPRGSSPRRRRTRVQIGTVPDCCGRSRGGFRREARGMTIARSPARIDAASRSTASNPDRIDGRYVARLHDNIDSSDDPLPSGRRFFGLIAANSTPGAGAADIPPGLVNTVAGRHSHAHGMMTERLARLTRPATTALCQVNARRPPRQ